MQQRLPSLYPSPIMFAHRGASAHAPENTLDSFRLALKLGATGLETDCWVTQDQHLVLDHDGLLQRNLRTVFRSRKFSDVSRNKIAPTIPTFQELLLVVPDTLPISVDIADPAAMSLIAESTPTHQNPGRIFICHPDIQLLANWKREFSTFKFVNSIRLSKITEGPERRCANLSSYGIDVLNMHHTDWNGGLVALAHRFEIAAFSWDIQHTEQLRTAFVMGVDAVYSDWSDRMVDAHSAIFID